MLRKSMEGTQLFSCLSCWSGLGAAEPVSVVDVQVTGDDDIVVGGVHLIQSIIPVLKERDIMARARARSVDSTDDEVSTFAKAEAEPDYFMAVAGNSVQMLIGQVISNPDSDPATLCSAVQMQWGGGGKPGMVDSGKVIFVEVNLVSVTMAMSAPVRFRVD